MNVQTKCTKKEYKEEVEQTQDAKKAISLAHYYSVKRDSFQLHVHNMHNNKGPVYNSRAVCWLCKAKEYLGKQNLSELIDIDKFLLNSSEFASDGIFDFDEGQEVVEAIVKCSTI
ncbi:MAG: hypothetical protein Q8K60_04220, partial [Parachlamydiaceae bacterium]|nr:hypothetical protein [Parachlamydiaceae bacterium]